MSLPRFGPVAAQSRDPRIALMSGVTEKVESGEDCLYVNVFAPAGSGGSHPVLVWIASPSTTGSASTAPTPSRELLRSVEVLYGSMRSIVKTLYARRARPRSAAADPIPCRAGIACAHARLRGATSRSFACRRFRTVFLCSLILNRPILAYGSVCSFNTSCTGPTWTRKPL
jgi:hypothetical protein